MIDQSEVAPLLVCEKTAARLIGISQGMLVAGRFRKHPLLPFVRIGTRTIRYRRADIDAFIAGRVVSTQTIGQPTSPVSPTP